MSISDFCWITGIKTEEGYQLGKCGNCDHQIRAETNMEDRTGYTWSENCPNCNYILLLPGLIGYELNNWILMPNQEAVAYLLGVWLSSIGFSYPELSAPITNIRAVDEVGTIFEIDLMVKKDGTWVIMSLEFDFNNKDPEFVTIYRSDDKSRSK
jgi:hypothetical protein